LNRWCSNFTQAKQYADDHSMPLIAVMSKDGCSNCRVMEASFLDDVYKSWMNSSGFLFYFAHLGETGADITTAKKFIMEGNAMPMSRIWWKSNG